MDRAKVSFEKHEFPRLSPPTPALSLFNFSRFEIAVEERHTSNRFDQFEVVYTTLTICVVGPVGAGLYFIYGAFHHEISGTLSHICRQTLWEVKLNSIGAQVPSCLEGQLLLDFGYYGLFIF